MQSTDPLEHAPVLTPGERKELRARAHHLDPVVMIGEAGLTESVLAEARRAIEVHELIKIRVFGDDRELRQSMMTQLCEALACAPVQMIGKLLVVYRPRPAEAQSRPRGPHVPKKAAAIGKTAAPRSARRPAAAKPAADTAPRAKVWGTEATGRPTTHASRADPRGSRAGRPSGSRSGGLSGSRGLASRGGRGPAAGQGPSRAQGKSGGRKR